MHGYHLTYLLLPAIIKRLSIYTAQTNNFTPSEDGRTTEHLTYPKLYSPKPAVLLGEEQIFDTVHSGSPIGVSGRVKERLPHSLKKKKSATKIFKIMHRVGGAAC